jgi:hypothetical protein
VNRADGAQSPHLAAADAADPSLDGRTSAGARREVAGRSRDAAGARREAAGRSRDAAGARPDAAGPGRDISGLLFVAEMYGVQLDQLAAMLAVTERRAGAIAAGWAGKGQAEAGRLGPGPRWIWLTRTGLTDCGLPYAASPPALSRLAHLRAVTAARLALEAAPGYAAAGAHWRSERRLRARLGGRLGRRDHLPDAEVHWPDCDPAGGPPPAWAGECWAIEVELTPKTVTRTIAIMRELLGRTGDYGCPAAEAAVPGRRARHARAVYLCSAAALGTVGRARDALGADGARVEIRALPRDAGLAQAAGLRAAP